MLKSPGEAIFRFPLYVARFVLAFAAAALFIVVWKQAGAGSHTSGLYGTLAAYPPFFGIVVSVVSLYSAFKSRVLGGAVGLILFILFMEFPYFLWGSAMTGMLLIAYLAKRDSKYTDPKHTTLWISGMVAAVTTYYFIAGAVFLQEAVDVLWLALVISVVLHLAVQSAFHFFWAKRPESGYGDGGQKGDDDDHDGKGHQPEPKKPAKDDKGRSPGMPPGSPW